jgi:hypothetical protein
MHIEAKRSHSSWALAHYSHTHLSKESGKRMKASGNPHILRKQRLPFFYKLKFVHLRPILLDDVADSQLL